MRKEKDLMAQLVEWERTLIRLKRLPEMKHVMELEAKIGVLKWVLAENDAEDKSR